MGLCVSCAALKGLNGASVSHVQLSWAGRRADLSHATLILTPLPVPCMGVGVGVGIQVCEQLSRQTLWLRPCRPTGMQHRVWARWL